MYGAGPPRTLTGPFPHLILAWKAYANRAQSRLRAMRFPPPLFACLISVLPACGSGTTDIIDPPPPPPVNEITVRLLPDTADLATAGVLGWSNGIPAAQLRLVNPGTGDTVVAVTSGPDGSVKLVSVPAGSYDLWVHRWLSAAELAGRALADDAIGFVTVRRAFRVTGSGFETTVRVPASRRGALVFAELAMEPGDNPATGSYDFGGYLVIANNADSTIYLDGMLLGVATSQPSEIPGAPCAERVAWIANPNGLWTSAVQRFPGAGQEFPIGPGERRMIATDAIDHRPLYSQGYDLRGADFEFRGSADVDNPNVPDMATVGLRGDFFGHGLSGPGVISDVWFIALPTEMAGLQQGLMPFTVYPFQLMPAERVLHVASNLTKYDYAALLCGTYVHPRFDRSIAMVVTPYEYGQSTQRLRTGPNRTGPYQWTRSSDVDLVKAPKTAPR